MTKLINLRLFRKRKKRAKKAVNAEENRYRFGQTKTEKLFSQNKSLQTRKFLDQNRLFSDESEQK